MAIGTLELARPIRAEPTELIAPTTTLAAEVSNLRNQRDKDRLSGVLLRSRVTGASAWKWFSRIGEVHFALTRAAKIAGYAKISACKLTPQGTVEDLIDTGLAADTIQGVYSRVGGTRGLIERYFLQQKIAAESHLIRWMDGRTQDGYMYVSSKELNDGITDQAGIVISERAKSFALKMTTMPNVGNLNGAFERTIAQKDYLGRVWTPSPEWLDVPESPLEALDRQCDMLDTMTRNMHASMKSRFAIAGIMYFSNKVREAYGGTKVDGKTVLQILYDLMKQNLVSAENTADVTSILPILMMGDAEVGKVMEHLTIDRAIFETDLQLRSELIDRILFGLDINAPSTKGNTETSHWGAWQNCLTPDTEIMTATGWKRHEYLAVGEDVLTLNHDSGLSEWCPLEAVNVHEAVDQEMVSLEGQNHSSVSTLHHRWPVMLKTTESMTPVQARRWRTSEELTTACSIPIAAPAADLPIDLKWSDALVEVVGWTWTEGSMEYRHGRNVPRISIYQSHAVNPGNVARIHRSLTALFGEAHAGDMPSTRRSAKADPTPRWRAIDRGNGMTLFKLNSAASASIAAVVDHRHVDLGFIRELTASQLELFLTVSLLADGHGKIIGQKKESMLAAFELAAILAGYSVTSWSSTHDGFTEHTVYHRRLGSKDVVNVDRLRSERVTYTGDVWCPTTRNGSWLARRNGKIFFTGNSADELRLAVIPELDGFCWTTDRLILRPTILAEKGDAQLKADVNKGLIGVTFELDEASVRANRAADARELRKQGLLGGIPALKAGGFNAGDLMDVVEYIQWVGVQLRIPEMACWGRDGTKTKADVKNIEWDKWMPQKAGPKTGPGGDEPSGPGEGDPGSPDDTEDDTPAEDKPI